MWLLINGIELGNLVSYRLSLHGNLLESRPSHSILWKLPTVYAIYFAYRYFHDFGLQCRWANSRWLNFAIFVIFSLLWIATYWSGNFCEDRLTCEIRENNHIIYSNYVTLTGRFHLTWRCPEYGNSIDGRLPDGIAPILFWQLSSFVFLIFKDWGQTESPNVP